MFEGCNHPGRFACKYFKDAINFADIILTITSPTEAVGGITRSTDTGGATHVDGGGGGVLGGLVCGDDLQQLHLVHRREVVHADHLKIRDVPSTARARGSPPVTRGTGTA